MTNNNYDDVVFPITTVVNMIETRTGKKLKLRNSQAPEYVLLEPISEQELLDLGFKFIGYSSFVKCPIYRLGNIEAIFNETILHIYSLTS